MLTDQQKSVKQCLERMEEGRVRQPETGSRRAVEEGDHQELDFGPGEIAVELLRVAEDEAESGEARLPFATSNFQLFQRGVRYV
jgi:hypothetical protein